MTATPLGSTWERFVLAVAPATFVGSPWIELAVVALIYTSVLLLFVRVAPLGARLSEARRRLAAAALQILMYYRSPRAVIRGELELIASNLRLLALFVPTLLFGAVVFMFLFPILSNRYDYRPLQANEEVVVRLQPIEPGTEPLADGTSDVDASDLDVVAVVRAGAVGTAWIRVAGKRPGLLDFRLGPLGQRRARLNVEVPSAPAQPWLYVDGVEVHIDYPRRSWRGIEHGWLMYFLFVCFAVVKPLARWLRVSI